MTPGEFREYGKKVIDQIADYLEEIESLEPERAAELIMAARAHWFENEQQG